MVRTCFNNDQKFINREATCTRSDPTSKVVDTQNFQQNSLLVQILYSKSFGSSGVRLWNTMTCGADRKCSLQESSSKSATQSISRSLLVYGLWKSWSLNTFFRKFSIFRCKWKSISCSFLPISTKMNPNLIDLRLIVKLWVFRIKWNTLITWLPHDHVGLFTGQLSTATVSDSLASVLGNLIRTIFHIFKVFHSFCGLNRQSPRPLTLQKSSPNAWCVCSFYWLDTGRQKPRNLT